MGARFLANGLYATLTLIQLQLGLSQDTSTVYEQDARYIYLDEHSHRDVLHAHPSQFQGLPAYHAKISRDH